MLKQILWILAVDGVPGSHNPAWSCPLCQPQLETPSTHTNSPRFHCFWQCSVAAAVRHEIDNALAAWCPTHTAISRRALWLLEASRTSPPLHKNVWTVVCLAVLEAMEHSRRAFQRAHSHSQLSAPTALANIVSAPATRFWQNLADLATAFTSLPPAWVDATDQPFITVQRGRLVLGHPTFPGITHRGPFAVDF